MQFLNFFSIFFIYISVNLFQVGVSDYLSNENHVFLKKENFVSIS